ncbi:MAG: hypothetical protein A2287_09850 [Candidatus Melainabacteria bacterium RIFOXYA12_FULL_32_12]|nr:MAG: hypothetical protein A2104_05135 [Candidatus Melainabacteria bacterium GWF2_32_7]OGI21264.1 MAG: hypothetical protein A2255_03620 [Candidatus Melainabacteria bacterium RIFOXYA2_FULL_32_9]OGI28108.1 MAG: hypothetical protein A2287_09850 [Candidatus Melainabacteria bacterium RIFOXYA12_FULL_32_12]
MFDRKCKIIFISHGSTIYTDQNRLYEVEDYPPINEKGQKEIYKLANWLRNSDQKIDTIYTSPASRAIQSARIISKNTKNDFEILDTLYERRAGIWGGLTLKQIEGKYPELFEQYKKNPCNFSQEGGESTINLNIRVKNIINQLVKKNFQKRIVIVTYPCIIQSAISAAICIPPESQERVYIPTASATQINYYIEWSSLVYSAYLPL